MDQEAGTRGTYAAGGGGRTWWERKLGAWIRKSLWRHHRAQKVLQQGVTWSAACVRNVTRVAERVEEVREFLIYG